MTDGLPGKHGSYWTETAPIGPFPPLSGDGPADVAIIGGGMVGLLTALMLLRRGRSVIVLEARRIAAQVSGRTTAKITAQHGLIYAHLVDSFGEAAARLYGQSHSQGLDLIAGLADELGADCDFERKNAYVYGVHRDQVDVLRREAEAARRLGLPATFETDVPLPFVVAGAVRFAHQAQFHPVSFLRAVATAIRNEGGVICEETRVLDVDEGEPCLVRTERGDLRAGDVVVATNLPILDRGGFFARAFPGRHVVMAAPVAPQRAPDGMFLSVEQPSFSVRSHLSAEGPLLIATGPSFKAGEDDPSAQARLLAEFIETHFGVQAIGWRWGNQDYRSMDGVPYIGRMTPLSRHLYTATGFGGWGMTGSAVSAMLLTDLISGASSPWAELYDPNRFKPAASAARFVQENLHVAKQWVGERLKGVEITPETLAPGEGAVISEGAHKIAVFRDAAGHLRRWSASCPHMGCILSWNAAESSFDCPCHGSRFDSAGQVLNGPAVRGLTPR